MQAPEQVATETASVIPVHANPTPDVLARCAANQASGVTRVTVQNVFTLEQFQAAFDTFSQGTLGKVVISTE